jgi:ParB-like chromosome segregation protein Spo0J
MPEQSFRVVNHSYNPAEPIANLREHPRNPRRGNLEKIEDSISHNGFYGAVVAQLGTGYVLRGNHTFRKSVQMGAETIPTIWVEVDDATALNIVLADNGTHEGGGYDNAILQAVMTDVYAAQGTLAGTGYSEEDWRRIMGEPFESFTDLPGMGGLPETGDEGATPAEAQRGERAPTDGIVIPERWDVLVECPDEAVQATLLERLSREGYSVRALIS